MKSIANIYNMYTVRKNYLVLSWSCSLPSCNNLTKEKQVELDLWHGCCCQTLYRSCLLFFLKVRGVPTRASASCEKWGRKKCPWLSNNRISGAWLRFAFLRKVVLKLEYTSLIKVCWACLCNEPSFVISYVKTPERWKAHLRLFTFKCNLKI